MTPELIESSIKAVLGADIQHISLQKGEISITLSLERLLHSLQRLRDDSTLRFEQLMDICGVDYPERPQRFEVVYHLLSLTHNHRLRVKILVDEKTPVPSITSLWAVASWFEREAFDLYGILFSNHPDLRRILTDYNFDGHPMRKDFPLTGFIELRYNEEQKRVVYEPVKLQQDFRRFDTLSPWEGMTSVMLPGDEKATSPPAEKK